MKLPSRDTRWNSEPTPFLHPRPARDPRIICNNLAMVYVCGVQTFHGTPPASVTAKAFSSSPHVNIWYLVLLAVSSLLVFSAACVRREYTAVSLELTGSIGGTVVYLLFALAAAHTVQDFAGTQSFAWAFAFCLGSVVIVVQRLRQIW